MSRIYLEDHELRARETRRTLTGLILGVALTLLAIALWHYSAADEPAPHPALERGCRLPQIEGAWTIFGIVDGRLRCWRFQ